MKFPKIPMTPWMIRNAYRIFDVESSGEAAVADNRLHEYAFVLSEIAKMDPGKLLDVGCSARVNVVSPFACWLGWLVDGLDNREWSYHHDNFTMRQQDARDLLPDSYYNVVVALSTLEHVGIAGRYGIRRQDDDADIEITRNLLKATAPYGALLFTAPFTKGNNTRLPLSRQYNTERIKEIMSGWTIQSLRLTPDNTTVMIKAIKE